MVYIHIHIYTPFLNVATIQSTVQYSMSDIAMSDFSRILCNNLIAPSYTKTRIIFEASCVKAAIYLISVLSIRCEICWRDEYAKTANLSHHLSWDFTPESSGWFALRKTPTLILKRCCREAITSWDEHIVAEANRERLTSDALSFWFTPL